MKIFIVFAFLIITAFLLPGKISAFVYVPLPPATGGGPLPDSSCSGAIMTCWNSSGVGITDCGTGCPIGSTWERRDYDGCYSNPDDPSNPYVILERTQDVCSTGDKCFLSDGPYLRAGYCNCTTGNIYKVCCSTSGGLGGTCNQFSIDNYNPPYEGACPAGTTTDFCGWGGYPACNSSACGPPPPPAPRLTSATAYCNGSSANLDIGWTGSGDATYYEISYGPNGWGGSPWQTIPLGTSGVATITGFTPNQRITFNIRACNSGGCSGYDTNGYYFRDLPAACGGTLCPGGTANCGNNSGGNLGSCAGTWTYQNNASYDTWCQANAGGADGYCYSCTAAPTNTPTPTPSGPSGTCPNVNPDGSSNQCRSSCLTGSSAINGVPNAACQGAYGASISSCCRIDPGPGCPLNMGANATGSCVAASSCSGGSVLYNGGNGNAACANALGNQSGSVVCCCTGSGCAGLPTPTPTPVGGGTTSYTSGYTSTYTSGYTSYYQTYYQSYYQSYYQTTYTWCGDGACNGAETALDCDDCTVTIQGRLWEDLDDNGTADAPYAGTTVSLSGTSSGSDVSDSNNNPNFSFTGRTATNDAYSLNFVMPPGYELVPALSHPKPRNITLLGSGDPERTNTYWVIVEENVCDDGINNDGDGGTDCGDSACHTDGNPSNASTCCDDPPCQETPPGGTECSDSRDNSDPEDTLVDGADPGCHTDGDATDGDNTWDPNDDSETDLPDCTTTSISPNPVNAGGQATLTVDDCINTTPTVTPTTTPPFEWTPTPNEPPGDGRECSDASDNDSDSLVDSQDPGCHADGNPNNPGSYDPNDDDETNGGGGGTPECSDNSDNDGDTLIDELDAGCHDDNDPDDDNDGDPDTSDPDDDNDGTPDDSDPTWTDSYDPNDDDESGPGGGGSDPECSDGTDNDSDSFTDINDPGCHTDGNPSNPGSYDPNDDHESSVPYPECSDGRDNSDPDSLVDYQDPECHDDGDPTNPDTYNPDDPSESSPANSCEDASISNTSNNASYTTGTATWTAPACPGNGGLVCPVEMTVNGQGGSTDISLGNITVNPTWNITVQVHEDTNYNDCSSGSTPYGGNVQVGLLRSSPVPQQTSTRTMTGGTETFSCQMPGNYEVSIATPNGYRGVGATLISGGPQSAGSQVSTNQYNLTLGNSNPVVRFCVTTLAPWIQTDSGDVRFNIIDNPVPAGQSASRNATNPSLLFSSSGDGSIGLGSVSPDADKEWIVDDEYSYNRNMKSVNGAAAYTFYKARVKQRNIAVNVINSGAQGAIAPSTTGVFEITGDANGDFNLTGYTHPTVSGAPGRVVLLVPGDLTISSEIDVPLGGLLIVAVQGSITIAESVGEEPAGYASTDAHLDGIFTAEGNISIPGNLCTDGATQDRKLNIAGSIVANARKPFADDPTNGGRIENQRSLCQDDADYASVNVASRPDFLLQLTDFYKTTYTRWKEVRP